MKKLIAIFVLFTSLSFAQRYPVIYRNARGYATPYGRGYGYGGRGIGPGTATAIGVGGVVTGILIDRAVNNRQSKADKAAERNEVLRLEIERVKLEAELEAAKADAAAQKARR